MSGPRCLLIGAGRIAGGFVVPLLRAAGWEVDLVCRDEDVRDAIHARGGFWIHLAASSERRWIDGVNVVGHDNAALSALVTRADLLATAVGPSALPLVGRMLGPLLGERLATSSPPCNLITFENHRRAPELLADGLIDSCRSLARALGHRLGIGGSAVWRAVSLRRVTSEGVYFEGDSVEECYADAASLLDGVAPLDGSVSGLQLVRSFDNRMVEKLWLFNAGHAAAAYLGWQAGCVTIAQAMARPDIRALVQGAAAEAQKALTIYLSARPGSAPIPARPISSILDRYADVTLSDPVVRVGREPRRKLAAGDRLIGPSVVCLDAGLQPRALATAAAAALAYAEPSEPQACDLQREIALLGPEEVLAAVSTLDPHDRLVQLVADSYRERQASEVLA